MVGSAPMVVGRTRRPVRSALSRYAMARAPGGGGGRRVRGGAAGGGRARADGCKDPGVADGTDSELRLGGQLGF